RRRIAELREGVPAFFKAAQLKICRGVKWHNCYIQLMKAGNKLWIFSVLGAGVVFAARALTADDSTGPYHGIVDRNVFNLKPPTQVTKPEEPRIPPPKITLTGIFTILGGKRAGFKV